MVFRCGAARKAKFRELLRLRRSTALIGLTSVPCGWECRGRGDWLNVEYVDIYLKHIDIFVSINMQIYTKFVYTLVAWIHVQFLNRVSEILKYIDRSHVYTFILTFESMYVWYGTFIGIYANDTVRPWCFEKWHVHTGVFGFVILTRVAVVIQLLTAKIDAPSVWVAVRRWLRRKYNLLESAPHPRQKTFWRRWLFQEAGMKKGHQLIELCVSLSLYLYICIYICLSYQSYQYKSI